VTERSGIRNRGFGMGACAADFDNDGWVDLYLTNFGPNVLYRNNADGTFTDVTAKAVVGSPLWSASCAWGDIENDGDLDLFVTNYVDFTVDNNKYCGDHIKNVRAYCHPNVYNGLPDVLYRNNGDGTFTDITREAGIYSTAGKDLGVVFGDYDNDGWADIYVANDSVPNFLFHNQGNGTFKEVAVQVGMAVAEGGLAKAGMGIDAGDYDNSGQEAVLITNFAGEQITLYRRDSSGLFMDVAARAGIGGPSQRYLGFGAFFFDADLDGWLDILVANGHIQDDVSVRNSGVDHAEPGLLFLGGPSGVLWRPSRESLTRLGGHGNLRWGWETVGP